MGRSVTGAFTFKLDCGYTVYGKRDVRSKSNVSYQMINPYFNQPGEYKYESKQLSLGSCAKKAKIKATSILNRTIATPNKLKLEKSQSTTLCKKKSILDVKFEVPIEIQIKTKPNLNIFTLIKEVNKFHNSEVKKGVIQESTRLQYQTYYNYILSAWQDFDITWINSSNIWRHIVLIEKIKGTRTAQVLESRYSQLLQIAETIGLISYTINPVNKIKKIMYKPQRARLSSNILDSILSSYSDDEKPYKLINELLLATKLRLEDCCLFRQKKGNDWEKRLIRFRKNRNYGLKKRLSFTDKINLSPYSYVDYAKREVVLFHQKTGEVTRLTFDYRISENHKTISDLLSEIKKVCVYRSEFLLHHVSNVGLAKVCKPLGPGRVSRKFTGKVLELKNDKGKVLIWNGTRPTIHEVKSLGIRIEMDSKKVSGNKEIKQSANVDDIRLKFKEAKQSSTISEMIESSPLGDDCLSISAGHRSDKTTKIYLNARSYNNQFMYDGPYSP